MKVADVLQDEQTQLMPVPRPFDGYVELLARVSGTSLIHLERNRYSVPTEHANSVVSLRIYHEYCCCGRWRAGGSAPALL